MSYRHHSTPYRDLVNAAISEPIGIEGPSQRRESEGASGVSLHTFCAPVPPPSLVSTRLGDVPLGYSTTEMYGPAFASEQTSLAVFEEPDESYERSEDFPYGHGVTSDVSLSRRSSSTTVATASSMSNSRQLSGPLSLGRPPSIDPWRVNQIRLFNDFLESQFPGSEAKADLRKRRSYLMALPDMDIASTPILRSAIEAVCYGHAGANYNDQRLIQASQQAYGKTLSTLVRTLNQHRPHSSPLTIATSILLIAMYDDTLPEFAETASWRTGWKAHYWGLNELLRSTGPGAWSVTDAFSELLLLNLRIPLMFLGVAKRKAIVLGEPAWRALSNATALGRTPIGMLQARAMQVPALLERTDKFLRRHSYIQAEENVRDLAILRSDFHAWSIAEASFSDKSVKHIKTVNAMDEGSFDLDIEEHLVMSSNTTFDTFIDFTGLGAALEYAIYWMFTLILDCTILRIMHFRPKTEGLIAPRTRAEVLRDATDRASDLARSAYCFAKLGQQGNAEFLDVLVALAESFFTEISAVKELGWCQSVRVATRMRLERLRTKQPKSLCRMGDMVEDLALATRFKSRNISSAV